MTHQLTSVRFLNSASSVNILQSFTWFFNWQPKRVLFWFPAPTTLEYINPEISNASRRKYTYISSFGSVLPSDLQIFLKKLFENRLSKKVTGGSWLQHCFDFHQVVPSFPTVTRCTVQVQKYLSFTTSWTTFSHWLLTDIHSSKTLSVSSLSFLQKFTGGHFSAFAEFLALPSIFWKCIDGNFLHNYNNSLVRCFKIHELRMPHFR